MVTVEPGSHTNQVLNRRLISITQKEWMEQRSSVLWALLLMIVVAICNVAINFSEADSNTNMEWYYIDISWLVAVTCYLGAILSGAAIMSTETNKGTLQFLTSLPISRSRVWCNKVVIALCVYALIFVVAMLIDQIYMLLIFSAYHQMLAPQSVQMFCSDSVGIIFSKYWICATIPAFCIATVVSPLVEQPIASIIVSMITFAACAAFDLAVANLLNSWTPDVSTVQWLDFFGFLTSVFALYISHEIFVHGESLKTFKRFAVLCRAWLFDTTLVLAALFFAYWTIYVGTIGSSWK